MLKYEGSSGYQFVDAGHFSSSRESDQTISLGPGDYYVIPLTSGIGFKHVEGDQFTEVPDLVQDGGELHPIFDIMVKDLFRKLDKFVISHSVEYDEFAEFFKKVGIQLS